MEGEFNKEEGGHFGKEWGNVMVFLAREEQTLGVRGIRTSRNSNSSRVVKLHMPLTWTNLSELLATLHAFTVGGHGGGEDQSGLMGSIVIVYPLRLSGLSA